MSPARRRRSLGSMARSTPTRPWSGIARDAPAAVVALGWIVVVQIAAAGLALGVQLTPEQAPTGAACQAITYAVEGEPTVEELADLGLAMSELHQHSGVTLMESDAKAAQLIVRWTEISIPAPASSPVTAGRQVLGSATSRWRSLGEHRVLISGVVEVNAKVTWAHGLDRANGLASVLTHELGHVLGLEHSPEPTSFMHPVLTRQKAHWSERDLEQLAAAGRQLGCRLPGSRQ